MNCHEARKWISPYLDSELGQTKTFEISEHLQQCVSCGTRFDAERRVDAMMRDRLDLGPMPEELWDKLQSIPESGRAFRWRLWGTRLAMAAVLALAVVVYWPDVVVSVSPQVVSEFVASVPSHQAFETPPERTAAVESVAGVLRREFGLSLSLPGQDRMPAGHFGFEVVSATVRRDQDGHDYVEVHLNCCGEPVLLAFARDSGDGLPDLFDGLPPRGAREEQIHDGVHVASRFIGGSVVVIAARHPVSHIIGGLRVVGV